MSEIFDHLTHRDSVLLYTSIRTDDTPYLSEIVRDVKLPWMSANRLLNKLTSEGYIREILIGYKKHYKLTETGKQIVDRLIPQLNPTVIENLYTEFTPKEDHLRWQARGETSTSQKTEKPPEMNQREYLDALEVIDNFLNTMPQREQDHFVNSLPSRLKPITLRAAKKKTGKDMKT